jgi:hypothetical protein
MDTEGLVIEVLAKCCEPFKNFRSVLGEFPEDHIRPEAKHTAIPVVIPLRKVLLRHLKSGFFVKPQSSQRQEVWRFAEYLTPPDIPVTGMGTSRDNPQRHQPLFLRKLHSKSQDLPETLLLSQEVIGGENHHHLLWVTLRHRQSRQPDTGGGVFPHGLDNQVPFRNLGNLRKHQFSELLGYHAIEIFPTEKR